MVSRPVEVNAQEADYMMSKPTVFLGMSGGVDSSVAALLLTEQGYDVKGVTLQVWEHEDENTAVTKKWEERGCCKVGLARHVAQRLGIPHEVVDTRETFRKNVVDDFIAGYLSGTTPNPCVRCNERVKFGRLYELAKARGADFVATGHYARVLPVDEGVGLFRGADGKKDQSYFLSVAALLLTEQGYDVKGVTLQVWEPEDENTAVTKKWEERGCCKVGLARHVAQRLGIPHEVVDTRETFRKNVVDDFIAGYLSGTTPNPCVRCNERVKFGRLYELAKARGADFVATGHYARVLPVDEGVSLFRGADGKKDQSYFLYRLPAAWLPQILFPVGHLQKTEVWKRAEELDLPADEMKESQEICFVTQGDYRTFLTAEAPQALRLCGRARSLIRKAKQSENIAALPFIRPANEKGWELQAANASTSKK